MRRAAGPGAILACVLLAGCSNQPTRYGSAGNGRAYDPRLGVYASPRVVADGEPIPRGGGGYLVGRPYVIGGRTYYPTERPDGYTVVGTASWYGDAFHGRRTANGEIFDKNSITAAHPTLPLPSYARVTNLKNGRSMIVRVNDRGPYHGGRVMDVSQRVAEALEFKGAGMAQIRVDYVGRASLAGSDDGQLLATLREDGGPAQVDGTSPTPTMLADAEPVAPPEAPVPARDPSPEPVVQGIVPTPDREGEAPIIPEPRRVARRSPAPVPPARPFEVSREPVGASHIAGSDRAGLGRLISFGGVIEPTSLPGEPGIARNDRVADRQRFAQGPRRPAAAPSGDGDAELR